MATGRHAMGRALQSYKRDLPPAHFLLEIQSFPKLSNLNRYPSRIFKAGGHKWSLSLYPNGDKDNNGSGYISLYLSIEETNNYRSGWTVHVNYKLFVHDKLHNKYLTIQDSDGKVRTFEAKRTQWGFSEFLSLKEFEKDSNGYLVGGSCAFGAEVFVIKSTGKTETLTMLKQPNHKFTQRIQPFSQFTKNSCCSYGFEVGRSKWKLKVYPRGNAAEKEKSLSVYLELLDVPPNRKVYADLSLRVSYLLNDKRKEKKVNCWQYASELNKGFPAFMPLKDLPKPAKGFDDKDVLVVEVQIHAISIVKVKEDT